MMYFWLMLGEIEVTTSWSFNPTGRLFLGSTVCAWRDRISRGLNRDCAPRFLFGATNQRQEIVLARARAYYLRSILHNWNDQNCREILSQISEALDPNYSRLLIHENVLPSIRAHWGVTAMDIMMMANVGAEERTELQWCQLIERAGLKVSKSWTVSSAESLVECTLLGEGPRT
ncbi:O-methyltransferase family 2 [Penicillium cf. griseofulvum]|nr:O-methyltransferase family 2 [Penicillium cf. griseofulvum]